MLWNAMLFPYLMLVKKKGKQLFELNATFKSDNSTLLIVVLYD